MSSRRPSGDPRVAAVIAARDEGGRVGLTVAAVRSLGVDQVVVVADGSVDGTAEEARSAGARVLASRRPAGKGAALERGLSAAAADVYLLVDGDVGGSASAAGALLAEVLDGRADLAIGVLPRDPRHGGFRIVKRLAAGVIRLLSGFRSSEPLSGQRAVRRELLDAVRPLAGGFGVEVAMTVDAVRGGFRVVEVPVPMDHAPTGRDLAGFAHRARQGVDLLRAAAPRALGRRWPRS
ncbi:MAG TPA: glycosyltransferase family 2 protein [Actinomycetota bacterium]|nr:glycosyltransferase family 2 protein [Actinomycetota bacterium]